MNIKKMLRQEAKQVLPDDKKIKREIKYRMGMDADDEVELGEVKAKTAKRKKLIAAAACGAAVIIAVCACIPLMVKGGTSPSSPSTPITPSDPGGIFGELTSAEEVYGFSAASAGMMIAGMSDSAAELSAAISAKPAATKLSGGREAVEDEQTIELINGYMELVESLISGDTFTVTGGENSGAQYAEYSYVMAVNYTDVLGEKHDGGLIYYNKTLEHTEQDDDETESEYSLKGVMLLEGEAYPLHGTHVAESEDDESEDQYTMRVDMGGDRYMLVEQKHEREEDETETEYSYTLYEGRRVVSHTTFSYESEDDETELVMTVSGQNVQQQRFSFEREGGEIVIHAGENGTVTTYTVRIVGGEYVYYRGNTEVDRGHRFDFDD